MNEDTNINHIDGVNYVRRTIPTADGPTELEGLTVRALIKTLQQLDQDAIIAYMAEQTEESRKKDLIIGVIAGALGDSPLGVAFLVGPESINAMKNAGMI